MRKLTNDWQSLIDVDPPPIRPITEETRRMCAERGVGGSACLNTGRLWTDKEYEEYRNRVLNTPLP